MKFFVALLLVISPFTDLDKIARVNKAKKEAKEAYLAGNYQLASHKYKLLIDSLSVDEEEVLLGYAHTMYNLNDTTNAVNTYKELSASANKKLASIAEQQLGQVLFDKKQYEQALEHYKNALRKNPTNQDARYNYELLKKVIQKKEEEKKDQDQDQENKDKDDKENKDKKDEENKDQEQKDQEKKEGEEQDKQNKDEQEKKDQEKKEGEKDEDKEKKEEQKDKDEQEGEKSEEKEKEQPKPTPSDKLKEMNISEEKAKMILEAMKNKEIQYIQQNRRKPTKKKDNDKPDW